MPGSLVTQALNQQYQLSTDGQSPIPVSVDGDPAVSWAIAPAPAVNADRFAEPYTRAAVNTLEGQTFFPILFPSIISRLWFFQTGIQLAVDTLTFTLRKNGVDTAQVIVVTPGTSLNTVFASAPGLAPVAFAASDFMSLKVRQSGAEAQAGFIARIVAG